MSSNIRTIDDLKNTITNNKQSEQSKQSKQSKPSKQRKQNPEFVDSRKDPDHDFYIMDDVVHFALKNGTRQLNVFATVSMDKWPFVSKYDWYLGKAGYPICYSLGKTTLHKFVYHYLTRGLGAPDGFYIDHIDRNKLNNTDSNLRLATPQENSFNKSTASNIKGVRKISEGNYSAVITKDGTKHEIKNIPTQNQAAEIYNVMAEELFGSFAALNKIDDSDSDC
jgi:hypothetical protein